MSEEPAAAEEPGAVAVPVEPAAVDEPAAAEVAGEPETLDEPVVAEITEEPAAVGLKSRRLCLSTCLKPYPLKQTGHWTIKM